MRTLTALIAVCLVGGCAAAGEERREVQPSVPAAAVKADGGAATTRAARPEIEVLQVHDRSDGARVDLSFEGEVLHVHALSPTGIGGTRLGLKSGAWPRKVVVHLLYGAEEPFRHYEGVGASIERPNMPAGESSGYLEISKLGVDQFEITIYPTGLKVLYIFWVDAYRR